MSNTKPRKPLPSLQQRRALSVIESQAGILEQGIIWAHLKILVHFVHFHGFLGGSDGKEYAGNAGDMGLIPGSDPWVRKIPWRRKWQPTPVFLPGEFHEQRSLAGCSPRGHKELGTTERLTLLHASFLAFIVVHTSVILTTTI